MRRFTYFTATNLGIMAVLGILFVLLPKELVGNNIGVIIWALVAGFAGSMFALFRSKSSAKRMAGLQMIETPRTETEQWLVTTVAKQAEMAGIDMPEVGIFDTPAMNAFATGANKNKALVAVSTGLLRNMTPEEAEAVMGHEIAHVANGDMVTMALIQGVVNTFVLLLARGLALIIDRNGRGMGYFIGFMVGQTIFGFLASIVVSYFSRQREFRADIGGADYASTQHMIGALERLKQGKSGDLPDQLSAFGINSSMSKLFSTHPPLEQRIDALRQRNS